MAATLTVTPSNLKAGKALVITGAGFLPVAPVDVGVVQEGANSGLGVVLHLTSDGTGAITSDGFADLVANGETDLKIDADDGTNSHSLRTSVTTD